jgi:hypothetical protein
VDFAQQQKHIYARIFTLSAVVDRHAKAPSSVLETAFALGLALLNQSDDRGRDVGADIHV